jgi:hypothetical protein
LPDVLFFSAYHAVNMRGIHRSVKGRDGVIGGWSRRFYKRLAPLFFDLRNILQNTDFKAFSRSRIFNLILKIL